ncbi:Low molecular weight protein-tyrosine-phosphatase wzb [compost metagenome]
MEKRHIEAIAKIAPDVSGKTMLFGHWLGRQEIVDPYRKSQEVFEHVYQLLSSSAVKWGSALALEHENNYVR